MNRQPSQVEHERCLTWPLHPSISAVAGGAAGAAVAPGLCDSCSLTVRGMRDDATRLAAAPHPGRAGRRCARRHRSRDTSVGAAVGLRWPLVATALALILLAGAYVAGAVVDRFRASGATRADAADHRRPHVACAAPEHGVEPCALAGRTSGTSVMPSADGASSASWPDRTAGSSRSAWNGAPPTRWCGSRTDGVTWQAVAQPSGVFGGSVPTSGALGRRRHARGRPRTSRSRQGSSGPSGGRPMDAPGPAHRTLPRCSGRPARTSR